MPILNAESVRRILRTTTNSNCVLPTVRWAVNAMSQESALDARTPTLNCPQVATRVNRDINTMNLLAPAKSTAPKNVTVMVQTLGSAPAVRIPTGI